MGICSRYTAAVLAAVFLSATSQAATRTTFNPSGSSIIPNAVSSSAISLPDGGIGLVGPDRYYELQPGQGFSGGQSVGPTIRPAPVSSIGTPQFPYGPGAALPNVKVPGTVKIPVKPEIKLLKPALISKLKNALKVSPGAIAGQVVVGAALAGVGWVMSDDQTRLQKKSSTVDGLPSQPASGVSPQSICGVLPASQTLGKITTMQFNGVTYAVYVGPYGTTPSGYDQFRNNCTERNLGYTYNAQGYWPESGAKVISVDDIVVLKTDLTESDFDQLGVWASSQTLPWLVDMIKEVCQGSLKPNSCFDEMKSGIKLSGPTSIAGPSFTKSGTYTRPDGSTGTTSSNITTNYTFNYGNTYFDTKTTTTTTNTVDGLPVSTETTEDTTTPQEETPPDDEEEPSYTFNDSSLPSVDPFYTQKYPDGFQGVWNSAKTDFDNSAFVSFLNSFIPSFSGSCPAFSLSFNIASWANYGTQNFSSLCYILDFVKACIMLGALFLCRAIVFGG